MTTAKNGMATSPTRDLLARREAGAGQQAPRPLDHLALSVLMDGGATAADALAAIARLRREFVDWNEVRVARIQEIVRVLGGIPGVERSATRIKDEYNLFFDKKGALNFDFLAAGKPAETRRALAQLLPGMAKGAVALLLYEFCPGAQLPLSDEALKQAKKDGLIGKNADRGQLSRLLADSLEPGSICLLLQYWDMDASGNPYGESGKREAGTAKKDRKSPAKPRAKAAGKHN